MEENILSPSGRIRRSTYWTRWAIVFVINVTLRIFQEATRDTTVIILTAVISMILGVFLLLQSIKRMHDVGKSGWFAIIPIYNFILAITDGQPGINKYGKDPKNRSSICPHCHAINNPDASVCESCGKELLPSGSYGDISASSDTYILVFIVFGAFNALVSFLIERLVPDWYSGSWKFVNISMNMIWAFSLILLAMAIKNEKQRTPGLVIGVIWALYILFRNLQWMLDF